MDSTYNFFTELLVVSGFFAGSFVGISAVCSGRKLFTVSFRTNGRRADFDGKFYRS